MQSFKFSLNYLLLNEQVKNNLLGFERLLN